jgi:hypothetical protein
VHDQVFRPTAYGGRGHQFIGILNEKGDNGRGFDRIHAELPLKWPRLANTRVKRAAHERTECRPECPSHYLRKVPQDAALQPHGCADEFPPSVIYGADDSFTQRFGVVAAPDPVSSRWPVRRKSR